MPGRSAPRPTWPQLPADLRAAVERVLGGAATASAGRAGGWSPGSADLLETADGGRVFVKAADGRVNPHTVALHAREAVVLRLLDGGPSPRLLAEVRVGTWIALVVEAVDGRHPDPLDEADVAAVLDAVAALSRAPVDALEPIEEVLAEDALGWERLRADSAPLPEAVGAALPALERLAARMPEALRGDSVVHLDLRIDNVLIDRGGRAHLVDWPSAVRGAGWIDAVTLLLDVRHLGGPTDAGLRHPVLADVPPEHVDVLLAVLGAYFFDRGRQPDPPGLPGIRAYQLAQGATAVDWLLQRRRR